MSRDLQNSEPVHETGNNSKDKPGTVSRRQVLAGAVGAAVAGIGAAVTARAQYTGVMEGGGGVPFRLPMGALNYLDRKQYIHNMEIISFTEGSTLSSGEPLMTMWARGARRLLPTGNGWLDISNPRKPEIIDLGMRMRGTVSFQEATKKWIFMETMGEPLTGAGPGHPHGRWDEEIRRKAESYTGLRGVRTYDVNDPAKPKVLGEFSTGATGSGTHDNYFDGGRYAYLDAGWSNEFRMENAQRAHGNGLMIVDMADPANIKEVARYHVPGQLFGEENDYKKYWFAGDHAAWTSSHGVSVPMRVEEGGKLAYSGFGHFGLLTLDLSDITKPKLLSQLMWDYESIGGIPYHTAFPVVDGDGKFTNIIIGVPETIEADCREPFKAVQVINVSDPRNPEIVGVFRRPVPPEDAPYNDFCLSRGRFGTHNSQAFIAPGASKPHIVATTHFNAGLRITDISNPAKPRELAFFLPPRGGDMENYESWRRGDSETVFIEWDRNLIWLGTHAGNYCLSCPALGEPVLKAQKIERWTVPHGNRGWDA